MWKKISDEYDVSIDGKIRNSKTNRILKQYRDKGGYQTLGLRINNVRKKYYVHRLVAEAFIPNYSKNLQVNHIDGVKHNNNVSNLEYVTSYENIKDRVFKLPSLDTIKNIIDLYKKNLTLDEIYVELRNKRKIEQVSRFFF
jgi:hypothetical protein